MDQKISDLDVAISMTASDIIPIVDSNGDNKVLHGSQVKDYVADAVVSDIDDVKAMISDEYDPERVTPYEAGDLVIYNNTLYKCLDTTSGAWDSTKWDDTTIKAEIFLKQDTLTVQTGTISSEEGTTILRQTLLKFGNVVFLTCDLKVANVVRWSTFATLPSGFRPNSNIYTVAINTGSSAGVQNAHVQINAGGNLAFGNTLPDANVQYSISVAWIVD